MSATEWIVVVVAALAVVAFVLWMLTTRRDPERAATHTPGRFRTGVPTERPAGPGAESQRVESHDPDRRVGG